MNFHHVGILVDDIIKYFEAHFVSELGISSLQGPVLDDNQKARTAMIRTGPGAGIELVSPSEPGSPLSSALQAGGGLHHLCYEVDDIDATFALLSDRGLAPVSVPTPAVLFEGLRVAFLFSRTGGLIELVESESGAARE